MRLIFSLVALLLTAGPALAAESPPNKVPPEAAGNYVLDKNHANIIFKLNHLGFSDYIGRFNNFDASLTLNTSNLSASVVTATITPASVDTNNAELEETLRGEYYFNVAQFPEIKFTSTALRQTAINKGVMTGTLSLLGVSKPVSLDVTFVGAGMNAYASVYTVGFRATGIIKRSDWGLKTLVPQVGDEVQILIEAEFHQTKE